MENTRSFMKNKRTVKLAHGDVEGEMKSERCQRTRGLRLESGRKMGDEASEG